MNPRLKSSKKWTAFPKEYTEQIQTVFKENFAQYLEDAELIVEGRIYTEEIMLRVGYLEKGRLAQANFEVSMNYSQEQQDAMKRIHNCIDAAASMMMEYLENDGDVDFDEARVWMWLAPGVWADDLEFAILRATLNTLQRAPAVIEVRLGSGDHLRAAAQRYKAAHFELAREPIARFVRATA